MQAGEPIPMAEVQAALADVLARAELDQRQSLLERFIEWLAPYLDTHSVQSLGDAFLWVFVVAAVAAALFAVTRAWATFRAPALAEAEGRALEAASAQERLQRLHSAAREARARGDLRLALRLTFHGLLLALGGRGDLELHRAWTNRELLRRGKVSLAARALLEPLARELEPKEFGRAAVSAEDVERLDRLLAPHIARGGT